MCLVDQRIIGSSAADSPQIEYLAQTCILAAFVTVRLFRLRQHQLLLLLMLLLLMLQTEESLGITIHPAT